MTLLEQLGKIWPINLWYPINPNISIAYQKYVLTFLVITLIGLSTLNGSGHNVQAATNAVRMHCTCDFTKVISYFSWPELISISITPSWWNRVGHIYCRYVCAWLP